MNPIKPKQDIVPLSKFRAHVAQYLDHARQSKRPVIITQHGEATAVLLSADEYEQLQDDIHVLRSVNHGLLDVSAGRTSSHEQAKAWLKRKLEASIAKRRRLAAKRKAAA